MPDEALLQALAVLRSHAANFNDAIVTTNGLHLQLVGDQSLLARANRLAAAEYVRTEYALVRKAAEHVLELMEVRR